MNKVINGLLIAAIALLLFGSGYRLGEYRAQRTVPTAASAGISGSADASFALLNRVEDLLLQKYVDQKAVVQQKLVYGAVKGMVAALNDPYTFFMTPTENKDSKNDLGGLYEGIGAQLGMKENVIIIVSPLKGSPALEAGVTSGDILYKVDGKEVRGWTLTQAVNAIRGKKDTTVHLTLIRNGQEVNKDIKRRQITVDPVELKQKDNIAILKISQFGDQTNALWDKYVDQIQSDYKAGKTKGLIIDLRSNPGGYLESAVHLASDLIPEGKIVVRQEYANKDGKNYMVERTGKLLSIPLVVLVDEGSASASEILSGALRDYDRAKLVGKKTFGKGSVQEAIDLENGTGLHVTVAKWILPKGDWINKKGINPDYVVENKIAEGNTLTEDTDAQLLKALELLQR